MPVPSPRNKILPARGNFADLSTNVASLLDGEICYAIDQDQYYQNEGGTLVSVGATKAQGALADTAVQPGDNVSDLTNDANYITLADVPGDLVTSVNTQTGDVVLDADDIDDSATTNKFATATQLGLADNSVQPGDNVSDLTNDANYIDAAGAPVQSVNTQTGDVVLGASDVGLGNVDNTSDADKPVSTATQAALDSKADLVDGHIPTSQIPAIAITEFLGSVGSEAAMLALVGQPGDWCLRTDKAVGYVIVGADPSVIAGWEAFTVPGSAVTSINTQVGDVVLGAADVGAATAAQGLLADTAVQPTDSIDVLADVDISTTAPTDGQALIWDNAGGKFVPGEAGSVNSVNGATGAVVLDTDDIGEGTTNLYSQWDDVTGGINYAGGNVGIGTTDPTGDLTISNSGANGLEFYANYCSSGQSGITSYNRNTSARTDLYVSTLNTLFINNGSEAMRISSNGQVGIGVTDPDGTLHLKASNAQIKLTPTNDTTQTARVIFTSTDGSTASSIQGGGSLGRDMAFRTTNEAMRISSGANVGIGTTDPRARVEVKCSSNAFGGGARLTRSDTTGYWEHVVSGDGKLYLGVGGGGSTTTSVGNFATNGVYTATSDVRRKKDISYDFNGSSLLAALKPVMGRMTEDEATAPKRPMFIAQDVVSVLPSAVSSLNPDPDAVDPILGVDYTAAVPVLTKALQEAMAEIDNLKARLDAAGL